MCTPSPPLRLGIQHIHAAVAMDNLASEPHLFYPNLLAVYLQDLNVNSLNHSMVLLKLCFYQEARKNQCF